jgi:glutamate carboxypeptidase
MRSFWLASLLATLGGAIAAAQGLSPAESAAAKAIDSGTAAAIELHHKIVDINSGSFNPAGVAAVADVLEPEFRALGFTTRRIDMSAVNRGPHLVAERKGGNGKRVLLIGHMDTVFEPSSPFQKWERLGGRATGPGAEDDKGGVIVMLMALRGLQAAGALDNANITVFLTGDEEAAGDPLSISRKDLIEAGKNADAALCFEGGSQRNGRDYVSTSRRGSTKWELKVTAKTGHSSGIFARDTGDGAIFELSRILAAFHDQLREPNMTYSVGIALGGENLQLTPGGEGSATGKDNIIAEGAVARGDLRVLTPEQFDRVKDKMLSIVAKSLPGTHSELNIENRYPPMAPTDGNKALLELRNEANRALRVPEELDLDPMLRGAGDISFVAPYVDSLSGLGANGSGSHAPGEFVNLDRLPLQAKRAAVTINRLIQKPR